MVSRAVSEAQKAKAKAKRKKAREQAKREVEQAGIYSPLVSAWFDDGGASGYDEGTPSEKDE